MTLDLARQIDVRTVILSSAAITLLLALCLGFGLRGQRTLLRRAIFLWIIATASQPPAWLLLLEGDAWAIVAANAILLIAYATYARALRKFAGHGGSMTLPYSLAAFGVVLTLLFTYVWPNMPERVVAVSPVIAGILALASTAIFYGAPRPLGASYGMTILVFAAGTAIFIARTIYEGFIGPPLQSPLAATPMQVLVVGYSALMPIVATFGFVLMCDERGRAELERLAAIDGLTGVLNRRMLEELVQAQLSEARRHLRPLSLMLLDVDHFKDVNDEYGHAAGDHALRAIVEAIRPHLRPSDLVGRLGGEEFLIVLSATPGHEALAVAERLRAAVEGHPIILRARRVVLTVSIGVVTQLGEGDDFAGLVKRADAAMYAAKRAGRNCVSVGT